MKKPLLFAAQILAVFACARLEAQTGCISSGDAHKLAFLIPTLYGDCGLTLPNPFHQAHFSSTFQESFTPLNSAFASQLSILPIVSPASGFVYSFDSSLGAYTRASQSFGPVLAERAETIGRHKLFLGASYQYFRFDSIDGVDMDDLPVVFRHQVGTGPPQNPTPAYEKDYITANNWIDLKIHQFTGVVTFGLTDRVDISAAIPILNVRMGATSDATIHRVAPPDPVFGEAHFFVEGDPSSVRHVFGSANSAQGLGDMTVRVKGSVYRGERAGLALAADFRAPTGDEYNLLGSGAWAVKPFVAASFRAGRVAPHVNLGYEWNGKTVLAGNVSTGEERRLPNRFLYTAGADIGLSRRVTVALDLLGQHIFNGERVFRSDWASTDGATVPTLALVRSSYDMVDGAAGVKINLLDRLLLNANIVFRLNDAGLRTKVTPLIGLSYTL